MGLFDLLRQQRCANLHVADGVFDAGAHDRGLAVLIEVIGERAQEGRTDAIARSLGLAARIARLPRLEAILDGRRIRFWIAGHAEVPMFTSRDIRSPVFHGKRRKVVETPS